MTNLELLQYALAGVETYIDVLERYEEPSEQRSEVTKELKANRISIEDKIQAISGNKDLVVTIMD